MRSLFLLLLLANLVVFAAQFPVVRRAVAGGDGDARPAQLNAERLRIIRESSPRQAAPASAT